MKRVVIIFLLLLGCIFTLSPVFAEGQEYSSGYSEYDSYKRVSTWKLDAIDPYKAKSINPMNMFYPGGRGNNQLIIYTPNSGQYTGTNEFGKEATVRGGIVVSFNGANSYIPPDGFVISGHGKAKTWISQNLIEGAEITIDADNKTITSVITPQSYLYRVSNKLDLVRKTLTNYKSTLPGYDYRHAQKYYSEAFDKFQKAQYLLQVGQYQQALGYINSALLLAEESFYYSVPAITGEFHGVWIRPVEKSRAEIANTVKQLKKAGIDNIFLETFYQGYTIFPSKTMQQYGLTAQRQEFQGWDPLKEWIKEAHSRGMKVHVWFQAFYVGNEDVTKTHGHILYSYPEWANVQRKNAKASAPQPSKSEHNGYFIDPANSMARTFLLSLISEIATNYNVDGFNIDYVRYPKSLDKNFPNYYESTWGYTATARSYFKGRYGVDPIDVNENHDLWQNWVEDRQNYITEFVSALKSAIGNRNILLSAVIFPDAENIEETKLQKWREWCNYGYVDAVTPLIMSSDEARAGYAVSEIRKLVGDRVSIYPGLFEPFTYGSPVDLLNQVIAIRQSGAKGFVIFDKAHLDEKFTRALSARVLRN